MSNQSTLTVSLLNALKDAVAYIEWDHAVRGHSYTVAEAEKAVAEVRKYTGALTISHDSVHPYATVDLRAARALISKAEQPDLTRYSQIKITPDGFEGVESYGANRANRFGAKFPLFLIHQALDRGCDFEDEADGYGKGAGTHGDWSGIRDSSDEAKNVMLEKALNFLFAKRG